MAAILAVLRDRPNFLVLLRVDYKGEARPLIGSAGGVFGCGNEEKPFFAGAFSFIASKPGAYGDHSGRDVFVPVAPHAALSPIGTGSTILPACLVTYYGSTWSHDSALAGDEVFASWTDVGIGSSVVIELVRQKAVADAGPSEALPDPPVIFNPRADEFDILIVRRENVLAAHIASIHNNLLRRPTKSGLDLLDCGGKIVVVWRRLSDTHAHRDAVIGISRDLNIIAQGAMPICVTHDPGLGVC